MGVLRIHSVPVFKDGVATSVSEIEEDVLEKYNSLLDMLHKYLVKVKEFISPDKPLSDDRELEALADSIVAFFKAPLLIDPYASGVYPTPYRIYWLWLISRFDRKIFDLFFARPLEEVYEAFYEGIFNALKDGRNVFGNAWLLNVLNVLFDDKTHEEVFEAFMKLPADTRVGLNSSSLIVHLLLTSAITAIREDKGRNILRIAALLHDIAKPYSWFTGVSHVGKSVEIAKDLLRDIVDDDKLREILEAIRRHHEKGGRLYEADRDSASIDRIVDLVAGFIAGKLGVDVGEVRDKLLRSGDEVREFWSKIPLDKLRELCEETARILQDPEAYRARAGLDIKPRQVRDVYVWMIDIRGIQEFIYESEDLKSLIAASHILDLIVYYVIPRILYEEFGVVPEAIVYAGGGIIEFLWRDMDEESVADSIRSGIRRILHKGFTRDVIDVAIAKYPLFDYWPATVGNLSARVSSKKILLKEELDSCVERFGFERLCSICRKRPATENVHGEYLCEICKFKEEVGKAHRETILWNIALNQESKEKIVSEYLMEYLAGHDVEEILGSEIKRILNLAIIKADGNAAGIFMSKSFSISSAVEKSLRLDLALKNAYRRLFRALNEIDNDEAKRVQLGILYAGGDDTVAIVPSWMAIPASLILIEEFWKGMGGACSLSVGVIASNAKYNIWGTISASESLLARCKRKFRQLQSVRDVQGVLSFYFVERGIISGSVVNTLLNNYTSLKLSNQPFIISANMKNSDLMEELKFILGVSEIASLESLLRTFYDVFRGSYKSDENKVVVDKEAAMNVRNARKFVHDVLSQCLDYIHSAKRPGARLEEYVNCASAKVAVYVAREMSVHYSEKEKTRYKLASSFKRFIIRNGKVVMPSLIDIFNLIKFAGGGAI